MKEAITKNVYELAKERIDFIFKEFDNIYVSFSGGKDSGVLLNLCIDHIRKNKLNRKIGVYFMDYEVQYKMTIDYVERIFEANKDILEVYRICVPFRVTTSTSMYQSYWRPWEEEKKDIWVRPMPENAYTADQFFQQNEVQTTIPVRAALQRHFGYFIQHHLPEFFLDIQVFRHLQRIICRRHARNPLRFIREVGTSIQIRLYLDAVMRIGTFAKQSSFTGTQVDSLLIKRIISRQSGFVIQQILDGDIRLVCSTQKGQIGRNSIG